MKYKIEYGSAWTTTETYETNDMKTAIELCENGTNLQYAVYINNKRYRPMSSFGKKINLNDEVQKQKFNYLID